MIVEQNVLQASGIDSVVLYSPRVFEKAEIKDKTKLLGTTVAVGFTKTLFILAATFLLDRVGRRPLLFGSSAGMILSLAGLGIGLTAVDRHGGEQLPWAIGLCITSILAYVAVAIHFFQQASGIDSMVLYSPRVKKRLRGQEEAEAVEVRLPHRHLTPMAQAEEEAAAWRTTVARAANVPDLVVADIVPLLSAGGGGIRAEFRLPRWTSPDIRRLLGRLLHPNPAARISTAEIVHDPWFCKGLNANRFASVIWPHCHDLDNLITAKIDGEDESQVRDLNAFDLIALSPALDLSGLFSGIEPAALLQPRESRHGSEQLLWAIGLCITSILAYVAFFSIGAGPITWVYSSEIFPLRLRALGASIGVAVNRVTSGVITMTFISLYHAITLGGNFFLYGGIAAVAWVFFITFLPETCGRILEDMEELFGKEKTEKKESNEVEIANGSNSNGNTQ
ncbi:polyol transporter 1 [Canna indica]|uniref:Polyol transporter 1 n=1 Tax=Canna indica TaxID=4628 RepID=A0AAQ3KHR2_9LILI|nr:polyol transporter 1 [Canna indica]